MKHKTQKLAKGHYVYRGYVVKSFDQRWLRDPSLNSTYWSVYSDPKKPAIQIAHTLGEAKYIIDNLLTA